MPFDEAYNEADQPGRDVSILLGNGFSIAVHPEFAYGRLLDEAKFGPPVRDERIRQVFDSLGTADFELVVRQLEATAGLLELYDPNSNSVSKLLRDRRAVGRALADAIAKIHPDRLGDVGEGRLGRCYDFLKQFDYVFTTNYDILLYWVKLQKHEGRFDDGFRRPDDDLVHVPREEQDIFWLHGAFHLREVLLAGGISDTVKEEWRDGIPLVDRLREDLEDGRMPLIVMEGTWEQKQRKVNSSLYLSDCLRRLRELEGSLFTYGSALSENDAHILAAIRSSYVTHLYVGLYGEQGKGSNPATIGQARKLAAESGRIAIHFWDAATASVW